MRVPLMGPELSGVLSCAQLSVEALNGFVLHYGPTLKVKMHAATDVSSALGQATKRPSSRKKK